MKSNKPNKAVEKRRHTAMNYLLSPARIIWRKARTAIRRFFCFHRDKDEEICYNVFPVVNMKRYFTKGKAKASYQIRQHRLCMKCGKIRGKGRITHQGLTRTNCARIVAQKRGQGYFVFISPKKL